ncbi:MAG: hypothetical protein HYX47_10045 [Burkholderiales bacterium]|nr:hypothetical protein [Burkholderiales bacterium]
MSLQPVVALALFIASAVLSIWVLQLGWLLAAVGLVMALIGAFPKARGVFFAGLALFLAPFFNVFILMPVLRQFIH